MLCEYYKHGQYYKQQATLIMVAIKIDAVCMQVLFQVIEIG